MESIEFVEVSTEGNTFVCIHSIYLYIIYISSVLILAYVWIVFKAFKLNAQSVSVCLGLHRGEPRTVYLGGLFTANALVGDQVLLRSQ